MNATQRKRLLKLADFIVEQVPKEKFDMGSFGNLDCGEAGCALSWATALFQKLGVTRPRGRIPEYKNQIAYGVGVPLFGLTHGQSEDLFSGMNVGSSAKQVRRDILRLVARLDKEAKIR